MPLQAFSVENYKCFSRRQELELGPITLLLGRNNAGKSAVARAPLLLESGIRTGSPEPLDTEALGLDGGGTFTDLLNGNSPHGSMAFGLSFGSSPRESSSSINVRVQNFDEFQMQVVTKFELLVGADRLVLDWDFSGTREPTKVYNLLINETTSPPTAVDFNGLLPAMDTLNLPGGLFTKFRDALRDIREDFDEIRYLGPFREQPQRFYQMPSRLPLSIGSMGQSAPSALALDQKRTSGELLQAVNEHLAENLPGWSLEVEIAGGTYSLVLSPEWNPSEKINIVDTGTGIAQVLPIFIQRALDAAAARSTKVLEIVEQPELHLHPSAHAQLADLYIRAAQEQGVRFLIETHSETFLLRLRRRIAEASSDFSHSDLAVYFAENRDGDAWLRRINVDPGGRLDYWPEGVFSEDYEETRALANAQISDWDKRADTD